MSRRAQLNRVFDGRERLRALLTCVRVALVVAVILAGCKREPTPEPAEQQSGSQVRTTRVPLVRALDFSDTTADRVLQTLVDESDTEVTFSACNDWLSKKVSIHSNQPKPVPVVMAMMVTQTGAPASVEGNQWTLFCQQAAGPGRRFRKDRPPEAITVPKEPESPK